MKGKIFQATHLFLTFVLALPALPFLLAFTILMIPSVLLIKFEQPIGRALGLTYQRFLGEWY